MDISIKADAAGIGILVSSISVWYRSILVPDRGTLVPIPDKPTKVTSTVGSSVRL